MTIENQIADHADSVLEVKKLESLIVEKFEAISSAYEKANGQLKEVGAVSQETKSAVEKLTTEYDALCDRMQQLEQKGAAVVSSEERAESLGAQFVKSEAYTDLRSGRTSRARLETKTAIINATGQNQPLVQSDRLPGIATTPERLLTIRDLLPASTTSSNLVEYTRESSFTNNAGPQIGGSPEQYENVTKPESAITFSLVSAPVITLAHFIPASKQVLEDSASLESHINQRLTYGLKLKEETQLLSGTGSNHELNGLITQATAYSVQSPQLTNEIDILRDAIKQAHVAEYRPDFMVLNPSDWYDIETRKVGAADDRYVVGNPASLMQPQLWGLPVVVTNSISAGTFLIGSRMGAEIKDRQQAAVEMSLEDSTNFQKNMVTIRAEERLTLCVYRTEAFITGSL
ncbi:MAG: phage major capsid protein [Chloroflexi bacterium]|nr:MAG: phage major capsid protein [Chloroflexota bacterium]